MREFKVGQKWNTRGAGVARIRVINAKGILVDTNNTTIQLWHDGTMPNRPPSPNNVGHMYDLLTLREDTTPAPEPHPIAQTSFVSADFTLRQFQTSLPWSIRYSQDFRSSPMSHKDFAHALHHVSKAAGKLHGLADDMDHDRAIANDATLREQYGKYVADLVVCALRLANTFPGGVLDLQAAVKARIEDKNGVML